MRKNLMTLVLCLLSTMGFAQTIEKDNVTSEGIRSIIGSLENVRNTTDKIVFSVALCNFSSENLSYYSLWIKATSRDPYKVEKGNHLLIKLANEEVITLEARISANASVRDVHNVNGFIYSDYSTIVDYNIDKETRDRMYRELNERRIKIAEKINAAEYDGEAAEAENNA